MPLNFTVICYAAITGTDPDFVTGAGCYHNSNNNKQQKIWEVAWN